MEAIILVLALIAYVCWVYLLVKSRHYDGKLVTRTNEEGNTVFTLELECGPEELMHRKSISFKVVSSAEEGTNG